VRTGTLRQAVDVTGTRGELEFDLKHQTASVQLQLQLLSGFAVQPTPRQPHI
jgi:hypothetical protein